jgi:hypothetical protein
MGRTVNFQYIYPYDLWHPDSRFQTVWDDSRVTLSGNYTYPLRFKTAVPYTVRAKIRITASNVSGASVLNRSWTLYRYTSSWASFGTFTMPSAGEYVWEGNTGVSNILKFAAVPTDTLNINTEWSLGLAVTEIEIRESLATTDLTSGEYHTLFANRYGVTEKPSKIFANINGALTAAKKILVNIEGSLAELPPVYSSAFASTVPDSFKLFEFTPPETGTYRFEVILNSGYHEARLYDNNFNRLDTNGYSFTLTGGSLYYITLTHYIYDADISDSVITIIKN